MGVTGNFRPPFSLDWYETSHAVFIGLLVTYSTFWTVVAVSDTVTDYFFAVGAVRARI